MNQPDRSRVLHNYVAASIGAGLLIVADSLVHITRNPPGFEWFVLAALTLLSGSFTVKLPSLPARLSVSETFVFTSVLLFGPDAGTLTVVLDSLVISFWMASANREPAKILFNATAPAIAIRVASEAFFTISGAHAGAIDRNQIGHLIVPVFAFALIYFLINATLVAGALAAETGGKLTTIWLQNFPSVSVNYFVGSSIAMLIVAYTDRIDLTVLGIIVPLLVISYLTFRSSLGRLDDANRHIVQINELYLSTIETLAMAVDAKDQITHGHIRRVQVYAIELAKRLGVSDDAQLKAIEAAALLHDMGKLAIPEYILNKPGRLSESEFAIMKRHADIGADLLSQVKFPYPVVPIVRHHHENWDGTGYPSRIAGTDIPVGARILSVVDCFDALNSDRPYRPRLTPDEAFAVLRDRRATMYDPLIVDTFIACYSDIASLAIRAGEEAHSVIPRFDVDDTDLSRQMRGPSKQEAARRSVLAATESLDDAIRVLLLSAQDHLPIVTLAFFARDPQAEVLVAVACEGHGRQFIKGIVIKPGERIAGWVAANQASIINSNARLDLGSIAESVTPPLRLTIATQIKSSRGHTIGVLSGYSASSESFSELHRQEFELLAFTSADALAALLQIESGTIAPLL